MLAMCFKLLWLLGWTTFAKDCIKFLIMCQEIKDMVWTIALLSLCTLLVAVLLTLLPLILSARVCKSCLILFFCTRWAHYRKHHNAQKVYILGTESNKMLFSVFASITMNRIKTVKMWQSRSTAVSGRDPRGDPWMWYSQHTPLIRLVEVRGQVTPHPHPQPS